MIDPTSGANQPGLTRRDLLKGAAVLIGTLSGSSAIVALAPSRVWALELTTLSQHEGETIIAFAQVLYPHQDLPTAVYALVGKDLDAAAKSDAAKATQLREGTAALNKAAGGNFSAASPHAKLAAVKGLEESPFFTTVRSTCITSLYDNEMAFAHFGYQGPSWPQGGYLHRGFNDLAWLPNPPATASPALSQR